MCLKKTCENVSIRVTVAVSKGHYVVLKKDLKLGYEVIIQIFIAWKVAGSTKCKQSETEWNCVVL